MNSDRVTGIDWRSLAIVLALAGCGSSKAESDPVEGESGSGAEAGTAGVSASGGTGGQNPDSGGTAGKGGSGSASGGSATAGDGGGSGEGARAGSAGSAGTSELAGAGGAGESGGAGGAGAEGGASGTSSSGGSGGLGEPMCPDHPPQLQVSPYTPEKCSVEDAILPLECEYDVMDPEMPGVICRAKFVCLCLSDHLGGSDCNWSRQQTMCPAEGVSCGDTQCGPNQYCRAPCCGTGDCGPQQPTCAGLPDTCDGVASCDCICGPGSLFCSDGGASYQCGCA